MYPSQADSMLAIVSFGAAVRSNDPTSRYFLSLPPFLSGWDTSLSVAACFQSSIAPATTDESIPHPLGPIRKRKITPAALSPPIAHVAGFARLCDRLHRSGTHAPSNTVRCVCVL